MSNVYISKALRKDIPSDAVILTRNEALEMHWTTIRNWKPSSDIWPFNIGYYMLAATNASSALNIINYYRRKVKLGNYGRISMVLPTITIPTIVAVGTHTTFVSNSILLEEECPLCIQTRAAFLQVLCSVVIPSVTSPLTSFHYASIYSTFDIPPVRKENLKDIIQLYWKLLKGSRRTVLLATAINATLASTLTYFEAISFYRCQQKIYEKEKELLDNN